MWSFLVIMGAITFGFSLIFLEFQREEDGEYMNYLYGTYMLWYGNFNDEKYTSSLKILVSAVLLLLSVVLLNLLIAIMGDSYDKVQEKKVLTESLIKVNMSLEAMALMQIIKEKKTKGKGYLIYCGPKEEEEDDIKVDEWEGKLGLIKKVIKYSEQKIMQKVDTINLKTEMDQIREELKSYVKAQMDEQAQILRDTMESYHTKVAAMLENLGKPKVAELKV